jgi:hypothetical protein
MLEIHFRIGQFEMILPWAFAPDGFRMTDGHPTGLHGKQVRVTMAQTRLYHIPLRSLFLRFSHISFRRAGWIFYLTPVRK